MTTLQDLGIDGDTIEQFRFDEKYYVVVYSPDKYGEPNNIEGFNGRAKAWKRASELAFSGSFAYIFDVSENSHHVLAYLTGWINRC